MDCPEQLFVLLLLCHSVGIPTTFFDLAGCADVIWGEAVGSC